MIADLSQIIIIGKSRILLTQTIRLIVEKLTMTLENIFMRRKPIDSLLVLHFLVLFVERKIFQLAFREG